MKTIEQVNQEVSKYGFTVLSYTGALEKAEVRCKNGHVTFRRYSDVRVGHGCPSCSTNQKYDGKRINEILISSNLSLVGQYFRKDLPIELRCMRCDHRFKKKIGYIKPNCCPHCRFINNLGDLDGYIWIGKERSKFKDRRYKHVLCCPEGHKISIASNDWKKGYRCNICNSSRQELEISKLLDSMGVKYLHNDRGVFAGKYELDFLIPDAKKAIEFNGAFWHSTKNNKDKLYHQKKSLMAHALGISLLHVYEHEWLNDRDKCLKRIVRFLKGEDRSDRSININIDDGIPHGCTILKVFEPTAHMYRGYKVYDSGQARIVGA